MRWSILTRPRDPSAPEEEKYEVSMAPFVNFLDPRVNFALNSAGNRL